MRVAAVQLTSTAEKATNLATAAELMAEAVAEGAELIVLPEMFNCLGSGAELRAGAEPLDGPTGEWAAEQARTHGIVLVAGSFIEDGGTAADRRNFNTCCVYGADGERIAVYRKIHLFDVDVPGAEYHESKVIAPGDEVVVVDPALTAPPLHLGLSICYDLRFPELFRIAALGGANVLTLPAAFTAKTGPPHWEVLIRARAIENQVFLVAAGQYGASNDTLRWHGHSMIVDPWGVILAESPDGVGVVVADLDFSEQDRVRRILPSLANRRPSAYRWP